MKFFLGVWVVIVIILWIIYIIARLVYNWKNAADWNSDDDWIML
jgi:hypothetical protein